MFCKYCGRKLEDSEKFCAICGARTDMQDSPVINTNNPEVSENKESKFENFMEKWFYKDFKEMTTSQLEKYSMAMSVLMLVFQLARIICVWFKLSTTFLFIGELFCVLSDWYFLSKMGIRGAWKLWGLFLYPVYLLIKARKTDRKYIWSILCAVVLIGGLALFCAEIIGVYNATNEGIAENTGSETTEMTIGATTDTTTDTISIESKINSEITNLVSKHNSFLEEAIIEDDATSYEMAMDMFLLDKSYFLQYEDDPYVYYAKYIQDQKDIYGVMLFFDESGELSKISVGASFTTSPNGMEGAYLCLRIMSYGMISSVNPEMTKDEVVDWYKEVGLNAGEYCTRDGVKYATYGTDELFVFDIVIK